MEAVVAHGDKAVFAGLGLQIGLGGALGDEGLHGRSHEGDLVEGDAT